MTDMQNTFAGRSNPIWPLCLAGVLLLAAMVPRAMAQDPANQLAPNDGGFIADWMIRATRIQSEQPHWLTPLTTITPRLEQEFRFDQSFETTSSGTRLTSYGYNKGLELIPCENVEVILGVPAWQSRQDSKEHDGFTDESFLLKYRVLSANEENGDYILTGFLGLTVPTGSQDNTGDHYIVTPTLASGKGWGPFDIQNTVGVGIPDDGNSHSGPGTSLVVNTAFQYKFLNAICPEVDVNYTYYPNGTHEGLNQLFLTPTLLLGRFSILNRVGFTIGLGYQVALTEKPTYNHNVILSARIPF
jgi:hypothetical protein